MVDVADQVVEIARTAGVITLSNQALPSPGYSSLDLTTFGARVLIQHRWLAQHGQDAATIVLCHNPDVVDLPVWGQYQGWILAGHTHGGQLQATVLPPPELPVRNSGILPARSHCLGAVACTSVARGTSPSGRFNVRRKSRSSGSSVPSLATGNVICRDFLQGGLSMQDSRIWGTWRSDARRTARENHRLERHSSPQEEEADKSLRKTRAPLHAYTLLCDSQRQTEYCITRWLPR